jgi:hypothetical protein
MFVKLKDNLYIYAPTTTPAAYIDLSGYSKFKEAKVANTKPTEKES